MSPLVKLYYNRFGFFCVVCNLWWKKNWIATQHCRKLFVDEVVYRSSLGLSTTNLCWRRKNTCARWPPSTRTGSSSLLRSFSSSQTRRNWAKKQQKIEPLYKYEDPKLLANISRVQEVPQECHVLSDLIVQWTECVMSFVQVTRCNRPRAPSNVKHKM